MTRILLGITYYWPNISGVSEYAKILTEELVKNGDQVEILTARFKKDLAKREIMGGVKIERINGSQLGKGFLMWFYPIKSLAAVRSYDVVNCHLPSIESFWLAIWAKILGKKLIVTHHCEFNFGGDINNKLIALISYPIHLFTYICADKIVAYTRDYANQSIFLRFFKNKIVYILPPIKVEKTKEKIDFGEGKIIGYVGRIGWEKGLNFLMETIPDLKRHFNKFKIVLVGPYKEVVGDESYEKLKKLMTDEVILYGPVAHEKIAAVYNGLDCLVLPSINSLESFGIVQTEAMVLGCPVVASNLPGVRVPVQMTGMGKITPVGNSEALAQNIIEVLKNGRLFYQKRAKNLELFDYKKTVEAYKKCFS